MLPRHRNRCDDGDAVNLRFQRLSVAACSRGTAQCTATYRSPSAIQVLDFELCCGVAGLQRGADVGSACGVTLCRVRQAKEANILLHLQPNVGVTLI
jgi:hypothetical protein